MTAHNDIIPWKREQVEGLEITLISKTRYEYLAFTKDGSLLISAGQLGGMIVGPVCGWRLKHGRLFRSDMEGNDLGDEMSLVSMTNDILTIRNSDGKLVYYRIHRKN